MVVIAFAPEVVRILAPNEYFEAIWVIPPLATSVFFIFLYTLFANIEFYYEENKFIMIASIIAAILNIILNIYLYRVLDICRWLHYINLLHNIQLFTLFLYAKSL